MRRPSDAYYQGQPIQRTVVKRPIMQPAAARPTPAPKPIDMRLPGATELLRRRMIVRRKKKLTQSRGFLSAMASVVVVVGIGGWLVGQAYFNLHRTFNGDGNTAVALQKKVNPNLLKGEGDGRVNILLLGNGGDGHEAPDLTDTLMVASIDPVNKKVSLVSVPRDLWINLPGHGTMKLNAAYETGKYDYLGRIDSSNANTKAVEAGFATADQAIEQVLGISIHYNLLVNFISFRQAVNTVGGVTVNVPETLYDPTMAWENNWNSVLAKKGIQHFTGHQALVYVRSRETSSDFARAERQRMVLMALKDKVTSLGTVSNPLKISKLMNTFGNNVKTDLSIGDAARVYDLTKGINDKTIKSLGLGDKNTLVTTGRADGQSIVLPTAGLFHYDQIQTYIREQLPDGYIIKEHAAVAVVNASGDPTVEAAKVAELKSYGYHVIASQSSATTQATTTVVKQSNKRLPYTKHYLARRFSTTVTRQLPGGVQVPAADFIIILGSDETASQ